jgi:predicted SprT family Zn-dependent metalloprotease
MKLMQAQELATGLMRLHGLPPQWSFTFDRAKVRFGKCNYRTKQISLSKHLVELNDEDEVRETILHEIAHALAPRGAGHGPVWRSLALSIGCNGHRCFGENVARPTPKYQGTCPSCQRVIHRHRRRLIACGRCAPVFDPRYLFVWSESSRCSTPPQKSRRSPIQTLRRSVNGLLSFRLQIGSRLRRQKLRDAAAESI